MTLFRQVADLPLAERADHYVRQQVPEALRQEVESLLQFDWTHDSLRDGIESAGRKLLETPSAPSGPSPHRTLTVPERIGRFQVERLLGRGGMGEVYLARDPVIDRPVAIKLIGSTNENETARRRLVREARTAGRLRHPNIVTIFEAGEHEEQPYIAMEFVPGETLRSLIGRRQPLPLRRRLEMIEGACAGLAHAHRAGVVHLDIKPDNLMVDDAGVVKVLDFGISRNTQADTLTLHVAGTLRYMSPEQIQGRALDHRSDTFSLGSALFELVVYEPAFTGSTSEIVSRIASGPLPRLGDRMPGAPPELDRILGRAMALDAAERYGDLDELREELGRVRLAIDPGDDPAEAPRSLQMVVDRPISVASSSSSTRRWRPTAMAAAAGVGVLVIVGAVLSFDTGLPGSSPEREATAPAPAASPAAAPASPTAAPAAAPTPAPGDDIWRLLARGERNAVLTRLDDITDPALARAVVDTVRSTVQRARDGAAAGAGTSTYRSGDEQMARATRLASSGRMSDALRALWQAGDLYARTSPAAVAAAPPAQQPGAPSSNVGQPAAPASAPPASTSAGDIAATPPPAVITPSPVIIPAPERPAAAAPPSRPTSNTAAPAPAPSDSQVIVGTLRRFDAAYESLDVSAVLRVFPSFGQTEAAQLRRTFEEATTYEQETRAGRVDVTGDTATVQATVARRIVPRTGSTFERELPMEIRLRRAGSDWVITAVSALQPK